MLVRDVMRSPAILPQPRTPVLDTDGPLLGVVTEADLVPARISTGGGVAGVLTRHDALLAVDAGGRTLRGAPGRSGSTP